ncbi:MAG: hypothetical protein DSZ35_11390 [Verrucomicrobia bacterium]|nr:MAG: hypothetical protein DSZ35_11390 [Verrucomicrobiota bacterium]
MRVSLHNPPTDRDGMDAPTARHCASKSWSASTRTGTANWMRKSVKRPGSRSAETGLPERAVAPKGRLPMPDEGIAADATAGAGDVPDGGNGSS